MSRNEADELTEKRFLGLNPNSTGHLISTNKKFTPAKHDETKENVEETKIKMSPSPYNDVSVASRSSGGSANGMRLN